MIKNERIKKFELKVQNKSMLIFDITRRKTDRKRNYQYCYSYIDVEVNPKRHIPSGTRIIDAYDVNDFKERLSKLFTKALKRGLPEQIIPEEIFVKFYPQLVDSESPSKRRIIPKESTLEHTTPKSHLETALNNRNFIVFQFKVFNALDEQKAVKIRLNSGGRGEYFEELILDPDVKSKDLLHNDHILLFIDPQHFKEWLWEGCNTTTKAKSIAAKIALPIREKYGTNLPRASIILDLSLPSSSDDPLAFFPPMSILRCPSCGSNKIKIRKEEYPLCLRCGYSSGDFRSNYPM